MNTEMNHLIINVPRSFTASFDVDAQCGFSPLCPEELPVPGGDLIVEELNQNATKAAFRVGSKDSHPANPVWLASPEHPILSNTGILNAPHYWPSHCVVGTKGNRLLPGLPKPEEYNFFVYKGIEPDLHPYGACFHDVNEKLSTGVIEWLKNKNIATIIVGGLATDYCVATTAIQLKKAGFTVIVNLASCRHISQTTLDKAKYEMTMNHGILFVPEASWIATI